MPRWYLATQSVAMSSLFAKLHVNRHPLLLIVLSKSALVLRSFPISYVLFVIINLLALSVLLVIAVIDAGLTIVFNHNGEFFKFFLLIFLDNKMILNFEILSINCNEFIPDCIFSVLYLIKLSTNCVKSFCNGLNFLRDLARFAVFLHFFISTLISFSFCRLWLITVLSTSAPEATLAVRYCCSC